MPGWFDTQGFRDPNAGSGGFVGPNGEVIPAGTGGGDIWAGVDPAIRDSIRYSQAPGAGGFDAGEPDPNRMYAGGSPYFDEGLGAYAPAGDMNPEGSASDPFAYTKGSLLTPWTRSFSSEGYGGGYSVPEFKPFSFGDFSYRPPSAGRFNEQYADPKEFNYDDFSQADFGGQFDYADFKAPTREDIDADPGVQFRLEQGLKARTASAANRGALRTGGFMKGLEDYAQGQASQEYGAAYGRSRDKYDTNRANRRDVYDASRDKYTLNRANQRDIYGTNRANRAENFDRNTANKMAGFTARQGAFRTNADVALQEGQLGFSVASGAWDRNYAKNRTAWDDERQYANQVASAGAANANQQYSRALSDYNRDKEEFWTNQDRQYAILDREATRGLGAAGQYGSQMMSGYGTIGNLALGKGDARAAGTVGSANAWNGALGTIGNYAGDVAAYYGTRPQGGGAAFTLPRGRYEGPNQGSGEGYW